MDIISDIIDRIISTGSLSKATMAEIEIRVRADWGGERIYIAKHGELGRKSNRDKAIKRDWHRGERIQYLSRKYEVSERRIRQIIIAKNGNS